MSEPDSGEEASGSELEPAEVFSLLGDDVRIEIIMVLDDAVEERVAFSELHDRVGLDDSGQFNYHLSKLVGHFVSKSDAGYQLTAAGDRLARAIAAGLYTDSPELEPFDVDGTCRECTQETLQASYADERFTITCRECDHQLLRVSAPPSLVRGRNPTEALDAFEEWSFSQVEQAYNDICPSCGGPVTRGITSETPPGLSFDVLPEMTCEVCSRRVVTSFAAIARRDSTVEGFHDREFPTIRQKHYWELDENVSEKSLELLSESPFRMQVTFSAGDRTCDAVIDEHLDILEATVHNGP